MKLVLKQKAPENFFESLPSHSKILLQILWNRGLRAKDTIAEYLEPDWDSHIHDPFLFRDMARAVARISEAAAKNHKVVIHGDYDTDGVCSSVILESVLGEFGLKADVFLPHREKEGYGLNPKTAHMFVERGYDLVICADCASSNYDEVETLRREGVDVIILDHHYEPARIPQAVAILNPQFNGEKYPFKELSATGVVFKLAQALLMKIPSNLPKGYEKWFLDLVAIATITDLMPLIGENRALVKYGILVLNKTKWPGLRELVKVAGSDLGELNEWSIAFQVGPRVNAAGRIDHASTAYELLKSRTQEEAIFWAKKVNESNISRKNLGDKVFKEAYKSAAEQVRDHLVLMAWGDWPIGVVGLVSSRITEQFYRPSIVIGKAGDKYKGSGRSVPPFNIIEAVSECSEFLENFGGHPQACGFTLKDEDSIKGFWLSLDKIAKEKLSREDMEKHIDIDMELDLIDVNAATWRDLSKIPPYGIGNREPRFLLRSARLISFGAMGDRGQHYWYNLEKDGVSRRGVAFEIGEEWSKLEVGDLVDAVYEIRKDNWQGREDYMLKIIDIGRSK